MTLPDGGALGEREVFVLPVVEDITRNKVNKPHRKPPIAPPLHYPPTIPPLLPNYPSTTLNL